MVSQYQQQALRDEARPHLFAVTSGTMTPSIRITSPSPSEILTYPLAIIRGAISSNNRFVYIHTPDRPPSTAFPVTGYSFTALYFLSPGPNSIRISLSPDLSHPTTLQLYYEPPPPTPPYVRLVYLLTSDSDGSFQSPCLSPNASDLDAGIARLKTAGLLIQSAAAEMMHAQQLERRTFRIAPEVIVHRLPITTAQAHKASGHDLWGLTYHQFKAIPQRTDTIDLAVMSFSQMTPSGVKAHTALGGPNLALFGGASMFTWPANIWEVPKRLLDFRTFDDTQFFDDSAFRMKDMGRCTCAATTLGALLHELGHSLSLPHPCGDAEKDGGGIMARGFDAFDSLFVQSFENLPFWDRGSALRLRYHRFLQFQGESEMARPEPLPTVPAPSPTPQPTPRRENVPPQFERERGGRIVCHSHVGIGHIGYYRNSDNAAHEEFEHEKLPRRFRVPEVKELRRRCQAGIDDKLSISAIDVEGRIAEIVYEDA